jgi:hypothetical protein
LTNTARQTGALCYPETILTRIKYNLTHFSTSRYY